MKMHKVRKPLVPEPADHPVEIKGPAAKPAVRMGGPGTQPMTGLTRTLAAPEPAELSSEARLAAIAAMPQAFPRVSGPSGALVQKIADAGIRAYGGAAVGLLRVFAKSIGPQLLVLFGTPESLKGLSAAELAERRALARAMIGELGARVLATLPLEVLFQYVPEGTAALFSPGNAGDQAVLTRHVAFERARNDVGLMLEHVEQAAVLGHSLDPASAKVVAQAQKALETQPERWVAALHEVDAGVRAFLKEQADKASLLRRLRGGDEGTRPKGKRSSTDVMDRIRALPPGDPERIALEDAVIAPKVDKAMARVAELKAEVTTTGEPDWLDRARGMMLASAIGDSLGNTTEFQAQRAIRLTVGYNTDLVGGGYFHWPAGGWTDDTQMAVSQARAIVAKGGFDQGAVAQAFHVWLLSDPPDVGGLTKASLTMVGAGVPPELSGLVPWALEGYFNAGNGSVMRAGPLAILTAHASTEALLRLAKLSSEITHADPRAVYGTAAIAYGAQLIVAGEAAVTAKVAAWLEDKCPSLASALKQVPDMKLEDVRTSGYVNDTVQAAFWLLDHTDNIVDALVLAANHGDDTDTAGATAGILLGAKYGASALPKSWTEKIDHREELEALAEEIAGLGGG